MRVRHLLFVVLANIILKGIDVSIPVNQLVVMTGVSGSGKSTFLFDILDKVARKHFNHASEVPGKYASVHGLRLF